MVKLKTITISSLMLFIGDIKKPLLVFYRFMKKQADHKSHGAVADVMTDVVFPMQ
ncbi:MULTISPECIES: hypothetical protein [Pectobacterium]|uniref:Uncharacterized protein n=1 Tax=Pectobacterium parvum TaxID=2778550 RepID=A0AAP9IGY5_9GAMM|nr:MULTISPECIES: hypothetical protein [Pectobacterium]MBA0174449.1 hypothetical protein [Pectobacterium carotovorum]MBA0178751.1 hypothetical protein [Pectobacterium carotovorum]MBA0194537.1 hypothetical protein [Pectobacterium carotovorum]MBL0867306.1 hypothetical protein [Pectobacterium carotovorum]MCA6960363.1 hypothetical protein [Pectobacterium odoriferum]